MTVATTPEPPEEKERSSVRFRAACRGCGRMVSKNTRKGLYWTCPHCKRRNPGPELLAELAKEPEGGKRRRVRRRELAAEKAAEATKPAAAPVRRKAKAPAAGMVAGESPAQGAGSQHETPAPAPTPRRSWLDRVMYGEGGDD